MNDHEQKYQALALWLGWLPLLALTPDKERVAAALAAGDQHLNTIPLSVWGSSGGTSWNDQFDSSKDDAVRHLLRDAIKRDKEAKREPLTTSWSLSQTVCLLKHVAAAESRGERPLAATPTPKPTPVLDIELPPSLPTLSEFLSAHPVTMQTTQVFSTPPGQSGEMWEGQRSHWRCVLVSHPFGVRKTMSIYFHMGSAHTNGPTLKDVLDCLASDSSSYENVKRFESWASDLGYDTDSRKALAIFYAVKRQAYALRRVLGDVAYDLLLWHTERE